MMSDKDTKVKEEDEKNEDEKENKYDVWTDTQKLIIIYGVARCLKYLHSQNILHRNLNSSNILLDEHLRPKISDFGLSKILHTTDKIEETPDEIGQFDEPELSENIYSEKVNVFSFGQILNEIACDNKTYENLTERCLDANPNERPSFKQIVDELRTNPEFITDKIDENRFRSYIKTIDDETKRVDTTLDDNVISQNERESIIEQDEKEEVEKIDHLLPNVKQIDLNEFDEVEPISSGGYASVSLIKNKKTGILYSAKKMGINQKSAFLQELKILSKVNHPLIIKLIGYSLQDFQQNPCLIIITEYMKNGTLEDYIKRKCDNPKSKKVNETMKIVNIYGIASAMNYLHSQDIIHCDLKPLNILVNEIFTPIICDFGISLNTNIEETIVDDFKGTYAYCPPEKFKNGIISKKGDVYSFAMVVYQILTNKYPFEGLSHHQIMYEVTINKLRPKMDNSIPKKYRELIERCWDEDPKKRPSFEQILNELRTNNEYINGNINKKIFHSFVKFMDEKKLGYDVVKKQYQKSLKYIFAYDDKVSIKTNCELHTENLIDEKNQINNDAFGPFFRYHRMNIHSF